MSKVPPTKPKKRREAAVSTAQTKSGEDVVCAKCGAIGDSPGTMHPTCCGVFMKRKNLPWDNPYR